MSSYAGSRVTSQGYPLDDDPALSPVGVSPLNGISSADRHISLGNVLLSRNASTSSHIQRNHTQHQPQRPSSSSNMLASSTISSAHAGGSISPVSSTHVLLPTNAQGVRTRLNLVQQQQQQHYGGLSSSSRPSSQYSPLLAGSSIETTKERPVSSASTYALDRAATSAPALHHSVTGQRVLPAAVLNKRSSSLSVLSQLDDDERTSRATSPTPIAQIAAYRNISSPIIPSSQNTTQSLYRPNYASAAGDGFHGSTPSASRSVSPMPSSGGLAYHAHPAYDYSRATQGVDSSSQPGSPFANLQSGRAGSLPNVLDQHNRKPSGSSILSIGNNSFRGAGPAHSQLHSSFNNSLSTNATSISTYETPRSGRDSPATSTPTVAQVQARHPGLPSSLIPGRKDSGGMNGHATGSHSRNGSAAQSYLARTPGSYDLPPSAASANTHESHDLHREQTYVPSQSMFERDRSMSVPRTVSDFGNDSVRSSMEMPSLPPGFADSRRPSTSDNAGLNSTQSTSWLQHKRKKSGASISSSGNLTRSPTPGQHHFVDETRRSEDSESQENTTTFRSFAETSPISPIAPKLDLSFGASLSDFSLDFGSFGEGLLGNDDTSTASTSTIKALGAPSAPKATTGSSFANFGLSQTGSSNISTAAQPAERITSTTQTKQSPKAAQLPLRSAGHAKQSSWGLSAFMSADVGKFDSPELQDGRSSLKEESRPGTGQKSISTASALTKSSSEDNLADLIASKSPLTELAKSFKSYHPHSSQSSDAAPSLTRGASAEKFAIAASGSASPASLLSSALSRPDSSLLGHNRAFEGRHGIADSTSSAGSAHTTAASKEPTAVIRPHRSDIGLGLPGALSNDLLARSRLSINKSLPPVPPAEVSEAPLVTPSSAYVEPPVTARSLAATRNVPIPSMYEVQATSSSTSDSTLRAPKGSASSSLAKDDLRDFGRRYRASESTKHRDVVVKNAIKQPGTIKPDPATEKLLGAVTAKLQKWIDLQDSRQRDRRGLLPSPTQSLPLSPILMSSQTVAPPAAARERQATQHAEPPASAPPATRSATHDGARLLDGSQRPPASENPALDAVNVTKAESQAVSKTLRPANLRLEDTTSSFSKLDLDFSAVRPLSITAKKRASETKRDVEKDSVPPVKRPTPRQKVGGALPDSGDWTLIKQTLADYIDGFISSKAERASGITGTFIPRFKAEELKALNSGATLSVTQRSVLLDWLDITFEDLRGTPANRGACLDAVSVIVESRLFAQSSFGSDKTAERRYHTLLVRLLAFAIDKLNGKAIFANTLAFAGKILAAAYWNLPEVGLKLLRLLPVVKRQHIQRIVKESGNDDCPGNFPEHLRDLIFTGNVAQYMLKFGPVKTGKPGEQALYEESVEIPAARMPQSGSAPAGQQVIRVDMTGNWLIRWTATDSDLPFAFMRAYHRQLANYMPIFETGLSRLETAQLISAPGYPFIAATLLEVCDALIHRNLRSVTTMAPASTGINANESANLQAGQKPKALEIVSKRVVQTIFEVVGGQLQKGQPASDSAAFASATMRHNFGCSLQTWIAATTKRTSMWDTRGIFALLDLIEGLIYNVCSPPVEEGVTEVDDELWRPSEIGLALFDVTFILDFVTTILTKADNTTCLLRTISFLYTEFASLTMRPQDRQHTCERVILLPEVFNRLFLYYNVGVRGYFLRLLVYRLARLGSDDDSKHVMVRDPRIYAILRLFESRLEKVRRRHDELDPLDDWSDDSEDEFRPRPKRSTICSTWGVHDKPWAMGNESRRSSLDEEDAVMVAAVDPHGQVVEAISDSTLSSGVDVAALGRGQSPHLANNDSGKQQRLSTAKKLAGGWWNSLTSKTGRKGGAPKSRQASLHDQITPFQTESLNGSQIHLPPPNEFGHPRTATSQNAFTTTTSSGDRRDGNSTRERSDTRQKQSLSREGSRRHPRRSASGAITSRSRRSSAYSFDISVQTPRSDAFDAPLSPPLNDAAVINSDLLSTLSPNTLSQALSGALSPGAISTASRRPKSVSSRRSRPTSTISERAGASPRVSKRFSKRASILPPAALDLLRDSPSEPVPQIPEQYRTPTSGTMAGSGFPTQGPPRVRAPSPPPYEVKQHPYAIRSLREYEDCLDEFELFVIRAKEEEGIDGKDVASLIPRLSTAWPSTWED